MHSYTFYFLTPYHTRWCTCWPCTAWLFYMLAVYSLVGVHAGRVQPAWLFYMLAVYSLVGVHAGCVQPGWCTCWLCTAWLVYTCWPWLYLLFLVTHSPYLWWHSLKWVWFEIIILHMHSYTFHFLTPYHTHIVDAAYEAVQKRTFLPMVILIATHLPLLVGVIVLYRWMGDNHSREKESTEMKSMENKGIDDDKDSDSEFEKRVTESSHLMQNKEGKIN